MLLKTDAPVYQCIQDTFLPGCVLKQPSPNEPNGKNKLSFITEDNLTGKCIYFVCVNPKGVDAKTIETDIAYGEILGTPLGSLQTVLQEVFQVRLVTAAPSTMGSM